MNRQRTGDRGIAFRFTARSEELLYKASIQYSCQGIPEIHSPGMKAAGVWSYFLTSISAKVKNDWSSNASLVCSETIYFIFWVKHGDCSTVCPHSTQARGVADPSRRTVLFCYIVYAQNVTASAGKEDVMSSTYFIILFIRIRGSITPCWVGRTARMRPIRHVYILFPRVQQRIVPSNCPNTVGFVFLHDDGMQAKRYDSLANQDMDQE